MVTIMDGRSGLPTEVPPADRGVLRLYEHLSLPEGVVTVEDMRILVVGDVLLRVVENRGCQVTLSCEVPAETEAPRDLGPFRRMVSALGVHPAADVTAGRCSASALGGLPTVCVRTDQPLEDDPGVWLRVGPVVTTIPEAAWSADDQDVLALRLTLLDHPYASPLRVTPGEVADADEELERWRALMGHWASTPSRPVPVDVRRRTEAFLTDDLDTPAVLRLMRDVEAAEDVPGGAKFETFALLDTVLGLELAREVGQGGPLTTVR